MVEHNNRRKHSMVQKPQNILSEGENAPVWYADGRLNACYLAVDKHLKMVMENSCLYLRFLIYRYKTENFLQRIAENVSIAGGLQSLGLEIPQLFTCQ
jgi:propionyl-CoA synthetase